MAVKLIGGVLAVLSCGFIGFVYSMREGMRIEELAELKKALLLIKSEAEFSLSSLPEACSAAAGRLTGRLGEFFGYAGARLMEKDAPPGELWREAVALKLTGSYLTPEDLKCLERLTESAGGAESAAQAEAADMAVMYIDAKTEELRGTWPVNRKMYRSVGVLCGLMIAILLI